MQFSSVISITGRRQDEVDSDQSNSFIKAPTCWLIVLTIRSKYIPWLLLQDIISPDWPENQLFKYVDDCYLLILTSHIGCCNLGCWTQLCGPVTATYAVEVSPVKSSGNPHQKSRCHPVNCWVNEMKILEFIQFLESRALLHPLWANGYVLLSCVLIVTAQFQFFNDR